MRSIGSRRGRGEIKVGGRLLCILRDVHQHRAWSSRCSDLEGFADYRGDVFSLGDQEVVLGDGQRNAGDVDFLKSIRAEYLAGDLAGNADNGNRIEHRGGY